MLAIDKINLKLKNNWFNNDTNVYIVLSMPLSDMGKGTVVAHMLNMLPNSDAIKFDGLLNTNKNGRHTASGHDDFGIYEKYNPTKTFGDERYILGGDLYKEFIKLYGEDENLCFRPHFYKYFLTKITDLWSNISKPKNIILEIGGTIIDYEVDSYVPPAIYYLKKHLKDKCKIILLSEISYNNEYIKTRTLQRAVEEMGKRFILPDLILAREPANFQTDNNAERTLNEIKISDTIESRLGFEFDPTNIITIPFYSRDKIDELGNYLKTRLADKFPKKHTIFLGSNNKSKLADYKRYLSDYDIVSPNDLNLQADIKENMYSLLTNSQNKSREWAKLSNLPTISEDTGFFIEELNGEPGVAVKRWGGELPENVTEAKFLDHLKQKIFHLDNPRCYFETVVSLAFPGGNVVTTAHQTLGYIDKNKLANLYTPDYPLSAVFIADGRNKTWSELTDQEKVKSDERLIFKIQDLINHYLAK